MFDVCETEGSYVKKQILKFTLSSQKKTATDLKIDQSQKDLSKIVKNEIENVTQSNMFLSPTQIPVRIHTSPVSNQKIILRPTNKTSHQESMAFAKSSKSVISIPDSKGVAQGISTSPSPLSPTRISSISPQSLNTKTSTTSTSKPLRSSSYSKSTETGITTGPLSVRDAKVISTFPKLQNVNNSIATNPNPLRSKTIIPTISNPLIASGVYKKINEPVTSIMDPTMSMGDNAMMEATNVSKRTHIFGNSSPQSKYGRCSTACSCDNREVATDVDTGTGLMSKVKPVKKTSLRVNKIARAVGASPPTAQVATNNVGTEMSKVKLATAIGQKTKRVYTTIANSPPKSKVSRDIASSPESNSKTSGPSCVKSLNKDVGASGSLVPVSPILSNDKEKAKADLGSFCFSANKPSNECLREFYQTCCSLIIDHAKRIKGKRENDSIPTNTLKGTNRKRIPPNTKDLKVGRQQQTISRFQMKIQEDVYKQSEICKEEASQDEGCVDTAIEKCALNSEINRFKDTRISHCLKENGIGNSLKETGIKNSLIETRIGNSLKETGIGYSLKETGIDNSFKETGINNSFKETGHAYSLKEARFTNSFKDSGISNSIRDTGISQNLRDAGISNSVLDTGNRVRLTKKGYHLKPPLARRRESSHLGINREAGDTTAKYSLLPHGFDSPISNYNHKYFRSNPLEIEQATSNHFYDSWLQKRDRIKAAKMKQFEYTSIPRMKSDTLNSFKYNRLFNASLDKVNQRTFNTFNRFPYDKTKYKRVSIVNTSSSEPTFFSVISKSAVDVSKSLLTPLSISESDLHHNRKDFFMGRPFQVEESNYGQILFPEIGKIVTVVWIISVIAIFINSFMRYKNFDIDEYESESGYQSIQDEQSYSTDFRAGGY